MQLIEDTEKGLKLLDDILSYFIPQEAVRTKCIDALKKGAADPKEHKTILVPRLETALTMANDLGIELWSENVELFRHPIEDTRIGVVKDLYKIAKTRYDLTGGNFPDFSILGDDYNSEDFPMIKSENLLRTYSTHF